MNAVFFIVLAFLFTCLFSGLYAGRNTKNFKQFAIGDKDFSKFTIVATMVATCLGGGALFSFLELVYMHGLYFGIPRLTISLAYLFISRYMVLRLGEFITHSSIAESMGVLFNPTVSAATALSGILLLAGTASCQLNIMARALSMCCGIDNQIALYVAVAVILIYATFGGIKAVTFTDVIQFITFCTLIPVMLFLVGRHIPSGKAVASILATHPNFDLRQVIGLHPKFMNMLPLMLLYAFPMLDPASMQRLYMAKNVWEVRTAFKYTGLVIGVSRLFVIILAVIILAVILLTYGIKMDPKRIAESILAMNNYVWVKSFLCIGILALAMSTADSDVHSATVLFTHDLTAVSGWKPKNKLLVAHLASTTITLLAFWIAFYQKDLFKQIMFALSFYDPIVSLPFVLAVFGFRPAPRSVLLGMGTGGLAMIGFKVGWFDFLNIQYPIFPAMFVNFLFLMGSHYLLPKVPGRGWVGIKDKTPLILEQQKKERGKRKRQELWKNFSLKAYLSQLIPKRSISFVSLGIYGLITQWLQIKESYLGLSFFLMVISSYLIIYPTIKENRPAVYQQVVTYLFPVAVFILLFWSSAYIFSVHAYSGLVIRIFLGNVAVALLFLPKVMVALMAGGAYLLLHMVHLSIDHACMFSSSFIQDELPRLLHIFVLFGVIYWIVLYWKQEIQWYIQKIFSIDQEIHTKQLDKIRSLNYQYNAHQLVYQGGYKDRVLPEISAEMVKMMNHGNLPEQDQKKIDQWVNRLQGYEQFLAEDRYNTANHLPLEPKMIDTSSILDDCMDKAATLHQSLEFVIDNRSTIHEMCCDVSKLKQLFLDGIRLLQPIESSIFYLFLRDTTISYALDRTRGSTKTLPALAFVLSKKATPPLVEESYPDQLDITSTQICIRDTHGLYYRSLNKVVEAHYGCWFMHADAMTIILPVNINEIRDEVMNRVVGQTEDILYETRQSLHQEKTLTALLVKQTALAEIQIQATIQFIKEAHRGQSRDSGEPYYTHPMTVARMLIEETTNPHTILAALLHDVIEDTDVTPAYLQSKYGSEVVKIVAGVTHFADTFRKKKLNLKENEEKLERSQDIRSVQIKIADRLHNVMTLQHRPIQKQQKVAQHTLDFYIPCAEKMGVQKLTARLKELCKRILEQNK